ncbi:MAG: hypothetical protein K8S97_14880 [Anaerolineae bacterium]|nr:hypothetical protein [Anaerolineae bacterium]
MNRLWIIILSLSLIITACGTDDEEAPVQLQSVPERTATPSPSPTPPMAAADTVALTPDLSLPDLPEMAGERLLFMYEETLYVGAFDGNEPHVVAHDVDLQMVSLAPDQRHLLYVTTEGEGEDSQLHLVDLATLETTGVVDVSGRISYSITWSPDGQWVAFTRSKVPPLSAEQRAQLEAGETVSVPYGEPPRLMIVRADGLQQHATEFVVFGQAWSWLRDGTFVVAVAPSLEGEYQGEALLHFDPLTGDSTIIDDATVTTALWQVTNGLHSLAHWRTAQAVLEPLGLGLAPPTEAQYWGAIIAPAGDVFVTLADVGTTSGEPCRNVALIKRAITAAQLPEIIYQSGEVNTLGISMVGWLPDDTILFVLQTGEVCDFTQAEGTLMRLLPSGETITLALHVSPSGTPCAVVPDGRYAACIRVEGERASIDLIDVADGTSTELLAAPVGEHEADSGVSNPFQGVYWLPS